MKKEDPVRQRRQDSQMLKVIKSQIEVKRVSHGI